MKGLSVEKIRKNSKCITLSLASTPRYNICWLGYILKHPKKIESYIKDEPKK